MRKVIVLTSVLMVALLFSSAAQAEVLGRFAVSPYGGVVIPIGDFADNDPENENSLGAKTGFGLGAMAEYGLTENVMVGGRFGYNQFGFDEDMSPVEGATLDGPKWTVMEFGAFVKLLLSAGSNTRPYFKAGVNAGKAKFKTDAEAGGESGEVEIDVATALGLEGGVGVLHMFSPNLGGFVEGSFNHLMTDGKDVELTVDGDSFGTEEATTNVQWIAVRAGVSFFFGGK
ncbi:MAG TPA: outer membrane beta-barrel protein [bacterium]|nr:outer membrane beta-barrel protein [bacterium]